MPDDPQIPRPPDTIPDSPFASGARVRCPDCRNGREYPSARCATCDGVGSLSRHRFAELMERRQRP